MATGTGSGKTECFLLPLLEHCRLQHARGQRGIKAILIDPMNALATDQARRIADLIHTIPALAGHRAGLYIGASGDDATAAMTATSVITDKEALHKAPPDILLTNYKQLDYLLIQPHVQGLWLHSGRQPDGTSVLRYLVVDEFHGFDGAQGTDLACLIRRLRDRLEALAAERAERAKAQLLKRAEEEANAFVKVLLEQRERILKTRTRHDSEFEPLAFGFADHELRQLRDNRSDWDKRLARIEPAGAIVLWPLQPC